MLSKDVVALVTGGASGIGKAIAEMIIVNGGKVVIADISQTGPSVAKALGERAIFVHTDVTSEEDVKKALALTKEKFGKLNVLVNCAGILRPGSIYDMETDQPHSLELWRDTIDINLFGTFNVVRLAIGLMKENQPDKDNQRGVIINTASVAGFNVPTSTLAYGISKAGVIAMTEPIAKSLGPLGIRVNTLAPGPVRTPLVQEGSCIEKDHLVTDALGSLLNLNRYGEPNEIAHGVRFIIENPLVNADVVRLDAGYRYCGRNHTN